MTARPRGLRPVGESALLIEVPDAQSVLALYRHLRASPLPGLVDLVPAATTVLVTFDPALTRRADAEGWLTRTASILACEAGAPPEAGSLVEIAVHYDGPDLPAVAALTGLAMAEVVAAHTEASWSAAFIGFAPGFAYLLGDDERLSVPRRATPRAAVPAGSVALAGGYCGIYPTASPGGWQLIGRTDAPLWDPRRSDPALLRPGTRVRFTAVGTA